MWGCSCDSSSSHVSALTALRKMTNPSRAMAETASSAVHEGYWSETGAGPAASQRHAVVGGVGGRWGLEGYPGAPRCSTWCRPPAARPTSRRAPGTMRACRQPSCGRSPRAHRRCTPSPSAAASRPCRRRTYWSLAGRGPSGAVGVRDTPRGEAVQALAVDVRREAARRRSADTHLERALLSSPVEHEPQQTARALGPEDSREISAKSVGLYE